MFEIQKIFHFEAGHQLKHHNGLCRQPHGHSYRLIVTIRNHMLTPAGPKKNMVLDFSDLSQCVWPMIEEYFDHKWLNDTLQTDSPTAEFMAKWIFDYLENKLPGLYSITVCETETAKAIYFSD